MESDNSCAYLTVPNGRFRIDASSGALTDVDIIDPELTLIHSESRIGLIRFAMPVDHYPAHHVEAGTHGEPRVEQSVDGVTLTYDTFVTVLGSMAVHAEVVLAPSVDGLRLHARIHNLGDLDIPQIVFPQIFGLEPVSGEDDTRLQLGRGSMYPFRDIEVRPDDAHFLKVRHQRYLPYGNREHSMKWLDYGSEVGGLSLFSCDTRYTAQGLVVERPVEAPSQAAIRWVHYPALRPGETWDSGDFVIVPHAGDWYAGARAYQRFTTSAYPYQAPRRIREALGIRTIWPAVRGELPTFSISQIDEYAVEIADPSLDLAELCVWHWWLKNGYPIVLDPRLGTEAEFRESLNRCQELGVPVSLFVSHHLVRDADADHPMLYLNSAHQRVQQNWTYGAGFVPRFGPPFAGTHDMSQGSARSPEWRERGLAEYERILEMGATSICFDQFRAWPNPDYNPRHDGRPDEEGEKLLEFARMARALIHDVNPDGTFSGEHITDVKVPSLDYTWEWKNSFDTRQSAPFRYVFPQVRLNANVNEHPRGALIGFMEGALLNIMPGNMHSYRLRDCPELVTMLRRLAKLRRRFLPYFTEGQYRYMEGLAVTGGDARLYTLGDHILVIAINPSDDPADVTVTVDPAVWGGEPQTGTLTATDLDGNDIERRDNASSAFLGSASLDADTLRIFSFVPDTTADSLQKQDADSR